MNQTNYMPRFTVASLGRRSVDEVVDIDVDLLEADKENGSQ